MQLVHANAIVRSSVINTLDSYQPAIGYFMNSFPFGDGYREKWIRNCEINTEIANAEATFLNLSERRVGIF